jgi:hypothetical protein
VILGHIRSQEKGESDETVDRGDVVGDIRRNVRYRSDVIDSVCGGTASPFVRRSSMAKEWSDHAWLAILAASCLIAAVLLIVALVAPDHLDVLRRHGW